MLLFEAKKYTIIEFKRHADIIVSFKIKVKEDINDNCLETTSLYQAV